MKGEVKLTGLDGVLDLLKSLPAEVVSKNGGPVARSLRKGAVVIHKQELANLAAVTANATDEDARLSTGFLAKNVVVTRGKPPTSGKGERYLVRVRSKGYPGRKGVTATKTARFLEYGTSKQPAEPWIRPAFLSRAAEAITTVERELVAGLDKIVKKLAAKTKGK